MSGARARLRRIGWILGLGIAISAAVLLGVTGASSTGSEGGVVLEVLEASVSDGRLKAAVSVTNNDSIRHELDAYVSLGVFSGGSAWDRRVIESTHQIVPIRHFGKKARQPETAAVEPLHHIGTTHQRRPIAMQDSQGFSPYVPIFCSGVS